MCIKMRKWGKGIKVFKCYLIQIIIQFSLKKACSSVAEHMLYMQKVPGLIPAISLWKSVASIASRSGREIQFKGEFI